MAHDNKEFSLQNSQLIANQESQPIRSNPEHERPTKKYQTEKC